MDVGASFEQHPEWKPYPEIILQALGVLDATWKVRLEVTRGNLADISFLWNADAFADIGSTLAGASALGLSPGKVYRFKHDASAGVSRMFQPWIALRVYAQLFWYGSWPFQGSKPVFDWILESGVVNPLLANNVLREWSEAGGSPYDRIWIGPTSSQVYPPGTITTPDKLEPPFVANINGTSFPFDIPMISGYTATTVRIRFYVGNGTGAQPLFEPAFGPRRPRKYGRSATPTWVATWEALKTGIKFLRNAKRVKENPQALRKTGKRKAKKKGSDVERTRYRLNFQERKRLACSKRLRKTRSLLKKYRGVNRKFERIKKRLETAQNRILRIQQAAFRKRLLRAFKKRTRR